jgi:MraZ protein
VTADFFHGYALNAVDAKNRLSVPSAYREIVERRSGAKSIIVAPGERSPCLIGYDRAWSAKLQAQLESRFEGDWSEARDDFARNAFGLSENLTYDDTGRIILSPMLKELAGIDKLALFLAAGDYFEIWNPETLLATKGETGPMGRVVRRLLDARG